MKMIFSLFFVCDLGHRKNQNQFVPVPTDSQSRSVFLQPAVAAPAGQTVDCRAFWVSPDHLIRRWRSDLSSGETVNPAGGAGGAVGGGGEICWSEVNTSEGEGGAAGGGARVTSLLLVTSCLDFLHLPLLGGESPCSSPGGGGGEDLGSTG